MQRLYALSTVLLVFVLCSCTGLLHSAKVNDVDGIKKALDSGTDIDFRDNRGRTALNIAAYSKNAEAVEYLCQMGADVNAKDNNGCTALIHAAYYNIVDVARILLKYNADQTITDRHGNTPLDYARDYGYQSMITLLEGETE